MSFLKNRTVLGVLCILLSLLICFGITPLFQKAVSEKAEIIRVVKEIKTGDEITSDTRRKKRSYLRREIAEVQVILKVTGREKQFPMLCTLSLALFAAGASIAIMLGNLFLIPVMAVGLMLLPFWYIRLTQSNYKKNISAELETALSIITTAYLRNEDKVISSSGTNNIDALKSYFCSEFLVQLVANHTGMDYDILIGGEYKILLEPIAYYTFQGIRIATTATEAALYDEQTSGLLRGWMQFLTHKNLPLAMFLEVSDLGYPAWGGSRTSAASNADIKSSLGVGIVRFTENPEPPMVSTYDYEYRVNTDVITSVMVSGGQSDPDRSTRVSFNIGGITYNVGNVYYPSGDSQLAWVRWTTPSTEQDMVIHVTVSGPGSSSKGTLHVKVVDMDKNPPPNPVADDRNDSFSFASVPSRTEQSSANWSIWRPWWQEYWVWHSDYDEEGNDKPDAQHGEHLAPVAGLKQKHTPGRISDPCHQLVNPRPFKSDHATVIGQAALHIGGEVLKAVGVVHQPLHLKSFQISGFGLD